MGDTDNRRGKVTDEHRAEAARLRALFDAAKASGHVSSQGDFGLQWDIGAQAAVGHFLTGTTALSLKAAYGFARGLGVTIDAFSTRLAALAADYGMASGRLAPEGLSPLAVALGRHLDNARGDLRQHEHAYAAAVAVIDAVTQTPPPVDDPPNTGKKTRRSTSAPIDTDE